MKTVLAWSGRVVSQLMFVMGKKLTFRNLNSGNRWDLKTVHNELFVPNLVLFYFLRGKSWKFQAPVVTHVSKLLKACPLKPIRPSLDTVLWNMLYSRKIFLGYWPVIVLSPTVICLLFLKVIRLLLLKSLFKCLQSTLFPCPLNYSLSPASYMPLSLVVDIIREYLLPLTRAPWTQVLLVHGLCRVHT
jgi:hypothetical protein